jgi:hypothetical protein
MIFPFKISDMPLSWTIVRVTPVTSGAIYLINYKKNAEHATEKLLDYDK